MAYYSVCSSCGCNLDPDEKCDCEKKKEEAKERFNKIVKVTPETGQLKFIFEGKEFDYEKVVY